MPVHNTALVVPEPGDPQNSSFAAAIAINQKYLAVGDYEANCVYIYTTNLSGQWIRTRTILPPKNSIPDRVGSGFGEQVQLEEDFLIVTAWHEEEIQNVTNPEEFTRKGSWCYIFHERYLIDLGNLETELEAIGLPMQKSEGLVTFNFFDKGKMNKVTLPDRGEASFGASFAHHRNLLLVGSPSITEDRGAWLYNLDELDKEPKKLAAPNIYLGNTVALNERFAVTGDLDYQGGPYRLPQKYPNQPKSTLIRANLTGLTSTFPLKGRVSLSGRTLAIFHPTSGYFVDGAKVEVRRISSDAESHLLFVKENVANAFVQNGFFITVSYNRRAASYGIHVQELASN